MVILHNLTREFMDDFTDTNFFLKLYLNLLVYHRNVIRSSSDVFGNLRKFSENVQQRSCDLRASFGEYSKVFGKWSEIFGK